MTPTVRRPLPVAVDPVAADPVAADPGWERTLRDERRPARDWDDLELAPSVPLEEVPPAPLPPTRSVWVPLALLGAAVFVLGFVGLLALGLPRTGTEAQPTRLPDPDPVPIAVRETPAPVATPTATASGTPAAAPLAATPLPPPATLPTAPATLPIAPEAPSGLPAAPRTALSSPARPDRVAPVVTPTTQPADEGPGFGILRIELEPAAEISIDGQPVGTHARHDALLEQGTHTVTLHFPGRTPFDRKVELRAGESVRLALQLDVAAP